MAKLLVVNAFEIPNFKERIFTHKEWDQVQKDLDRSMWRFTRGMRNVNRNQKREELGRIINAILVHILNFIIIKAFMMLQQFYF